MIDMILEQIMYMAFQKGTQTAPQGELCRRRREYKLPDMGVYDAPVGG